MTTCVTPDAALAFVREHGVVRVSAKGNVPRLTDAIAGEPVKGSWWAHPQARLIFSMLSTVTASDDILVSRLAKGKVTLVHRRLWPALVRLAGHFEPAQLAQVREEHTPSGRHANTRSHSRNGCRRRSWHKRTRSTNRKPAPSSAAGYRHHKEPA